MAREHTVNPSTPMPKGYAFLPKGIPYKTLHCRRLTHEAGKPLYIVQDSKKKTLGIRVPKSIFFHVQTAARDTLSARRLATQKRDAAFLDTAATELNKQFPNIPREDRDIVLRHGFKKYSGRVGRTSLVPMPRKVLLAVIAHVRHKHTGYDEMLNEGMDKDVARKAIRKNTESLLRKWGFKGDLSWYFDRIDKND